MPMEKPFSLNNGMDNNSKDAVNLMDYINFSPQTSPIEIKFKRNRGSGLDEAIQTVTVCNTDAFATVTEYICFRVDPSSTERIIKPLGAPKYRVTLNFSEKCNNRPTVFHIDSHLDCILQTEDGAELKNGIATLITTDNALSDNVPDITDVSVKLIYAYYAIILPSLGNTGKGELRIINSVMKQLISKLTGCDTEHHPWLVIFHRNLTDKTLSSAVKRWGGLRELSSTVNSLLANCAPKKITVSSEITMLTDEMIHKQVESVTVSEGVTEIGEGAFANCANLTSISLPRSLRIIRARAFENCALLTRITIPNGVERIEEKAFCGCTALKDVLMPDALRTLGASAFKSCAALDSIRLPGCMSSIGEAAFCGCASIAEITLPYGIETLEDNLFSDCTSLHAVNIAETTKNVGFNSFAGCASLSSISLPRGIERINEHAFSHCESLSVVDLPETLEYLGRYSFGWCDALSTVTYHGDKELWRKVLKAPNWNYKSGKFSIIYLSQKR